MTFKSTTLNMNSYQMTHMIPYIGVLFITMINDHVKVNLFFLFDQISFALN
jgi:hypothetical protein